MDIDTIFEKFGGPTKFGEAIGVARTHAGTMKTRGSIPLEYWDVLIAAAAERKIDGVNYEALQAIRRASRAKQRSPELSAGEAA